MSVAARDAPPSAACGFRQVHLFVRYDVRRGCAPRPDPRFYRPAPVPRARAFAPGGAENSGPLLIHGASMAHPCERFRAGGRLPTPPPTAAGHRGPAEYSFPRHRIPRIIVGNPAGYWSPFTSLSPSSARRPRILWTPFRSVAFRANPLEASPRSWGLPNARGPLERVLRVGRAASVGLANRPPGVDIRGDATRLPRT